MNRHIWIFLKYQLNDPDVRKHVLSWVDSPAPLSFITQWEQRFFLKRLVRRAFREIGGAMYKAYLDCEAGWNKSYSLH
jgi:hypothetical protein